jgi:hypothetical protein
MKDLPKGFPVLIEYPFKPRDCLKWKLDSFEISFYIDDSLFLVPAGYQRIQDLTEVIPQGNDDYYSLLSVLKFCKNI